MNKLKTLLKKPNNEADQAKRRILVQAGISLVSILMVVAVIFGMTAAWYSNVIQMDAITVKSADWTFTGKVSVQTEPIAAAPGDSGIIEVRIENDGELPADIRVDAKKDTMSADMRKRIYCYAEHTQKNQNGEDETVRTYLNSRSTYIYRNIAGGTTLDLTGQGEANGTDTAAHIYWQWVYDVLGYYVLGTVTETDGVNVDNQPIKLATLSAGAEYLMPVEYDLDTAIFDRDGELESVQVIDEETGEPTRQKAEDLIKALFTNYSKEAKYDAGTNKIGNYYAIDVDETGYGVWLYLGSWNDIAKETEYDTSLGRQASETEGAEADAQTEKPDISFTLVFTGQNTAGQTVQSQANP